MRSGLQRMSVKRYATIVLLVGVSSGLVGSWLANDVSPSAPDQGPSNRSIVAAPEDQERAEIDLRNRIAAVDLSPEIPLVERADAGELDLDPQWESLPVTRAGITFPERFLEGPLSSFPVNRLFRSRDLNPRGAYIPPKQRAAVSTFVEKEIGELVEMHFSLQQVGYHWLVDGIASGSVQPLKFKGSEAVAQIVAKAPSGAALLDQDLYEGVDAFDRIYCIGGVVYGLNFKETPVTRDAYDLLSFRRQHLALRVGEWFSVAGYLDSPEWRLYLERVYAPR
jgi:hypothetical protein